VTETPPSHPEDAAGDWPMLLATVHRLRRAIAIGGVCGLSLGLATLHLVPPTAGAVLLVAPADAPPRLAVPAPPGDAALALPSVADDREAAFGRYLAVLTAPEVAAVLLRDPVAAQALYPGYRREEGRLRPVGLGARVEAGWRSLTGLPALTGDDPAEAAERLARRLAVLPAADPRHRRLVLAAAARGGRDAAPPAGERLPDSWIGGGRRTVGGVALLGAADRAADALVRAAALESLAQREAYLRAALGDGGRLAARQAAATAMLEEVERERLRVAAGPRYAAMRISGPSVPPGPARHRGWLVPAAAAVTGMAAGMLARLLRRRTAG